MKKWMMLSLLCMMCSSGVYAQTFAEWFRQKKTQRRYLIEQIAALKVYGEYLQKGYRIAQDGLSTVRNITDGEFRLHDLFFSSLRSISPAIKNYGRLADIVDLQIATVRRAKEQLAVIKKSGRLGAEYIAYVGEVYGRLLDDCSMVLDELIAVTTAGRLAMRDDERMQRIDALYELSRDQYAFAEAFGQDALLLDLNRMRELDAIQSLQHMYRIEP